MKVIIHTSDGFSNYALLLKVCDDALRNQKRNEIEVVSGVDFWAGTMGEKYAIERGYKLRRFHADWSRNRMNAILAMDREMIEYSDALIVLWDGEEREAKHLIDFAEKYKLKIKNKIIYGGQ